MKRIIIFILIIVGFSVQNVNGQDKPKVRRQKEEAISFKEFLQKEEAKKEKVKGRRKHGEIEETSIMDRKKNIYRREVDFNAKDFWKGNTGIAIKATGITIVAIGLLKLGYDFIKNQSDGGRGPAGVPGNGPSGTPGNGG